MIPAPTLTRSKPPKCKRVRIPLFLGLFFIIDEGNEEIGVSFGSGVGSLPLSELASIVEETLGALASMLGVRDGVGSKRFSSAMGAMG